MTVATLMQNTLEAAQRPRTAPHKRLQLRASPVLDSYMLRIQVEALTYDDVSLVPAHSARPAQGRLARNALTRNLRLNLPIVSAAMDTVTEARLAVTMAQLGGIGILHKNMSVRAAGRARRPGQAVRGRRDPRSLHGRPAHDDRRSA
jgi:IMP dehydrogenase/GMP reductase